jgi:hypothetical protein
MVHKNKEFNYTSMQSSSRSSRLLYLALTNAANRSGAMLTRVDVQMLPQREKTRSTGAEEAGMLII